MVNLIEVFTRVKLKLNEKKWRVSEVREFFGVFWALSHWSAIFAYVEIISYQKIID